MASFCSQCHYSCRACSNGSSSGCTLCNPSSVQWNSALNTIPGGRCIYDFLNLRQFNDATTNVPPAIHFRVTIEFWTWIHNPISIGNVVANLVYNDFITVSLSQGTNTNDVDVFCTPLQFIYPLTGDRGQPFVPPNRFPPAVESPNGRLPPFLKLFLYPGSSDPGA